MSFEEQYPQHAKMATVKEQSQAIGEFLDWLGGKGIWLAKYEGKFSQPISVTQPTEKLLAEFFDIDLKVVEKEKRTMLTELRQQQLSTT